MNEDRKLEQEYKDKITKLLVALFPHAKIYLFGSRATGTNSPFSDIDIAIDAGKQLPITDIDEANSIMASLNIPYKVDIVDFHHISSTMQEIITKEKVIWKA
jgi:predicted nucleotidyltransferase